MDLEQGFQLGDLGGVLKRRGLRMAAIAAGTFLLFVFIAAVLPNRYESYATILVEPQTISKELVDSGIPSEDLFNRLHLIQMQIMSRARLSRIIDELHLYPEDAKRKTREEVIDEMRDDISVAPVLPELETEANAAAGVRASSVAINTFQLVFRYPNAEVAAQVANHLASDFIDQHIKERVEVSGDTSEFMDAQLSSLSKRIKDVEQKIAAVKGANAGRLPEDLDSNQHILQRLEEAYRDARKELAIAASDKAFYHQQLLSGTMSENYSYQNRMTPARRLEDLQAQLSQGLARGFTEKHPDIIRTRREIEDVKKEIDQGTEGGGVNIAQQNAQAEEQRAGLRVAAAKQEAERLKGQIEATEQQIAATPHVAEQLASLEIEHDHLFKSYQEYSAKNLEATVAASMERRQKGEQFRVLEAAYPAPEPTSPNRVLIMALGLILGIAFGGGAGLLEEATDSSFHTPKRLQEELRIPVLTSIPDVVLASDATLRRHRLVRATAIAAGATLFMLGISAVGYWWVNIRGENAASVSASQSVEVSGARAQ